MLVHLLLPESLLTRSLQRGTAVPRHHPSAFMLAVMEEVGIAVVQRRATLKAAPPQ